jgi:DNA-binding transcriptional regulator YiaG
MITSEKQLIVSRKKIVELRASILKMERDTKPFIKASVMELKSLIKKIEQEMKDYETLKEKGIEAIELNDLSEIMLLPIKYRIAKRMTQESFAREMEVPVRMIARYESEGYRNISGETLHKILKRLHLKILGKLRET